MRLDEFYNPEEDHSQVRRKSDTRKPTLTLEIINKLRKTRDLERAEEARYKVFARKMYGSSPEDEGSDGGGLGLL